MKLVDANVLLYAINSDSPHHAASRSWLDAALSGADRVGFSWVVSLAFVRLATKIGLFQAPLDIAAATGQLRDWLASPSACLVNPGPGHAEGLVSALGGVGVGGNLVHDAHLAVLAFEQRGSVVSYDSDFGRFAGLLWYRPEDLV